jgi:DNA-binding NtrC family response regulator
VVGTDTDCDLVLSDPTVSRTHAELQGTLEGLRVRDLGSTNGTFLQSSRITEALVPAGSTLKLGKTTIRVAATPAPTVPPSDRSSFGRLIGSSRAMREVFAVLELASPSDVTVLIEGESGTGKELAARAIHDNSPRAYGPFVVVDCSATQENLIESQLFGHRKGAFTGAVADRRGAFVEAQNGTLFLDEIGELPLPSQGKLLRALEARVVQPLGSDQPVEVDARVVAATHRDLYAMVEAKAFRFDLFHRIAVVHVCIPALRERPEDIPDLVRHISACRGTEPGPIGGENLETLQRHAWLGNVRELRNVLERAWVLSGSESTPFEQLRLWLHPDSGASQAEDVHASLSFKEAKTRCIERFERQYLSEVFAANDHNVTKSARHAGISRSHFRDLLQKYGIRKP